MPHLDTFFFSCHVADVTACKRLHHLAHTAVNLGEMVAQSAFSITISLLNIGDLSAQAALLCHCGCQKYSLLA